MPQADLQPQVTLTPSGTAILASWPAIEPAYGYHVVVTDPTGTVVLTADIAADGYQPPVTLSGPGIVPGGSYTVTVSVTGLPSTPASITLPTAADILSALSGRLVAARTSTAGGTTMWSYPLDATVLPHAGDANPGAVRTALTAALAPGSSTPLAITAAGDPVLDQQQLTLTVTGTSDALTADPGTAVIVTFSVTADFELAATWIAAPPDGWTLSSAFPALAETAFDYLPVSGVSFVATTAGHSDPAYFFPLQPGLQYQATLAVSGDLTVITGEPGQAGASYTAIGGPVQLTADGVPQFTWTAGAALGPLTIARIGQDPLTLNGGMPRFSCAPVPPDPSQPTPAPGGTPTASIDPTAGAAPLPPVTTSLGIAGQVTLGGGQLTCVLDLPTPLASELNLISAPGSAGGTLTAADATTALTDSGTGDVLAALLPSTLLSMAGFTVTQYTVTFSPSGDEPTTTTVTLGFGSARWPLVPSLNLSLSGLALTGTVIRAADYAAGPVTSWGISVSGQLSLGAASYAVTAAVPAQGGWYVEITSTSQVPTLDALAGLTGLSASQVSGVLPASLLALGSSFTLSQVILLADPAAQELSEVTFTIGQTSPWPLLGGQLTLSGWSAELTIAKGADGSWATAGTVLGSVVLSAAGQQTALSLELPVPIGEDQLWTLSLDPGSTIELPSIGQVLALFGAGPVALPTGVTTFGSLSLTGFAISVDPAAASLQQVSFACAQASDWVIIGPDILVVTGVAAAFWFDATSTPVTSAGQLDGTLVLAGSTVDVMLIKDGATGTWLVNAAYNDPVHVPGFAALDAWLDPSGSAAALPSTLPLASGIDVSNVALVFAGDTSGALTQIGFAVAIDDVWTVIPGYLSLTYLSAELTVPYPVLAAQITGTVTGVITLIGVDIAVSATKPDTQAPWQFTGTLLDGLTIDLVQAADSVTAQALALPADATQFGLPATITIISASVMAVPDTGEFHFVGQAGFDWSFTLGSASLAIRSIGGSIDIASGGSPLAASLSGTFDFAGINVMLTLSVGGAQAQTVLTGVLTPADAANISISGITDGFGPAGTWAAVAPAGLSALTFTGAAVYLNLTASQFLVYGAITCGSSLAADGMVYLSSAGGGQPWTYAVALALGPQFSFGALLPALATVDNYVQVSTAHLVVCDLAGQTLGALAASTTALLAQIAPAAPAPLAGLSGQAMAISTGAYFAAQIDFQPTSLFSRFLQIGSTSAPPSVWLGAVIDSGSPAATTFFADLPDVTIAGTIVLTHTDAYQGIHLTYTPAQAGSFTLTGQIALTGIFGSGYAFAVVLSVDDNGLTSTVTQTSQQIANPFGVPGIVVSGLTLAVAYTWAVPAANGQPATPQTSAFSIGGNVLLGPAPAQGQPDTRLSCTAALALISGTPAVFYTVLNADFSIGAFIAQCLTGSGANWPSGFIDITFQAGSKIYYYSPAADPAGTLATLDGTTLSAGFNVDAQITLTLVTQITLHGLLTVLQDPATNAYTGVQAGIALDNPVDLLFVQLASATPPAAGQPYTGGPVLAFQTGAQAAFGLSTGINFFGAAFLAAQVTVSKGADGGTVFAGHLTAAAPLDPFGVLSCGFTYTTHPGSDSDFAIDGWPDFTWVRNLVDFVSAIKQLADASDGSVCGTLADFIVNSAYSSSFSVTPSVSVSGTNLVFAFTGTYSLTITGASSPFVSLDLPAFSVPIPSTTTWDNVPEVLAAGVANASAQFAQDLLSQPDKIALFLAMIVGPSAVSVALELACNSLVDGAVAAAAEAAADAIAAVGGAAAAGAAAAAAAAIASSLANSGGGGGGGGGGGTTVATPNFRSLAYASGAVTGTWDAASGAAGYTFELLYPSGSVLVQHDYGLTLTGNLAIDPTQLPAGTYQGQVQGTRGQQTSGWATLPLDRLAGPAATLSYAEPSLVVSWPAITAADGYVVQFFDPTGVQVGTDMPVSSDTLQAQTAVPDPLPGAYTAQVRADKDGQFPGAYGTNGSLTVLSLPAPPVPALSQQSGVLTATWTAQPGLSYELTLTEGTTVLSTTQVSAGTATLTPSIAFAQGTSYSVALRASTGTALTPWTTTTFTFWAVPAPTAPVLEDDNGALTATWAAVTAAGAPAPVYNVQLIDTAAPAAPAAPVGSAAGVTAPPVTLSRADGQAPLAGAQYAMQVQAEMAGNIGPWATSPPIAVITLAPPAMVLLTFAPEQFSLTWTAPQLPAPLTGPLSYDLTLIEGGTQVGQLSAVTDTTADPSRTDGQVPAPGQVYSAQVRAVAQSHTSAWAASGPITIMDVPQLTAVSYAANVVTAAWTASTVTAAEYDIDLQPDPGGGGDFQVPVTGTGGAPAPTSVPVDMTGRARWTYTVRVRARTAGSTGNWSAALPVAVIDPPTGLAVSYTGGLVTASWNPVSGLVTSYGLILRNSDGAIVSTFGASSTPGTSSPPMITFIFPDGVIVPGAAYSLVVATQAGQAVSALSAPVPVELLTRPIGVTAVGNVTGGPSIQVSWIPVNGAGTYEVRIANAAGVVVFDQTGLTTTSVSGTGPLIVANATYTVTVIASQGAQSSPSGPVSVTVPALYTCLCLGTPPGSGCGNGAIGDNFDGVSLNLTQSQRDASYVPLRPAATPPGRTGWVGVPPGTGGEVAVLGQLAALLATKGILSPTDPFGIFMNSQPAEVRDFGSGGPFTCLCLGVTPGQGCGNGGIGDNFSGVIVNVAQTDLDNDFHPTTAPSRTGWVSVGTAPYIPLEVLLQLVMVLSQNGTLTGDEPYDVFNQSMSVTISTVGDGPDTCVALGAPIGSGTTTMGGHFGDVVVGIAAANLASYQPGAPSGWASIGQQPYSVYSAILQLVSLLAQKNILTGTQPYDIFNNAAAWRVIGG